MLAPKAPISDEFTEKNRWREELVLFLQHSGDHEIRRERTTDATETTLWSRPILDESAYWFEAFVVAKKSDSSERAAYIRRVLVFRNGAGATIQGAVTTPETIESDANWDCTFDVSDNLVRLRVTGVAATTIDWKVIVKTLFKAEN